MKIVRFKDGTFGVRRFNWVWMHYEFLDQAGTYWYYVPYDSTHFKYQTSAEDKMLWWKKGDERRIEKWDKGEPV